VRYFSSIITEFFGKRQRGCSLGYDVPQEYWNDERVNDLKERLRKGMSILKQIIANSCNTCE